MSGESKRSYAWIGVVVDLLLILVGVVMVSQGWWTAFGEVLIAVCSVGLVVSIVQLVRGKPHSLDD